jgi:hypothetical protein
MIVILSSMQCDYFMLFLELSIYVSSALTLDPNRFQMGGEHGDCVQATFLKSRNLHQLRSVAAGAFFNKNLKHVLNGHNLTATKIRSY